MRSRLLRHTAFLLLSVILSCGQVLADTVPVELPESVPELPVRRITFSSETTLAEFDVASQLTFRAGELLTREKLRASVEALYRREIFEKVIPSLNVVDGSVEVEFELLPARTIFDVEFSGDTVLDDKQLRRLAGIAPGALPTPEVISHAEARIIAGYRREGYFGASITHDVEDRVVSPQVIIHFTIDVGPPSRFVSVRIDGALPSELQTLAERAEARAVGALASDENVKKLRRELLLAVRSEGYLQASLEQTDLAIDPLSGDARIAFELDAHEPLSIVFTGNSIFSATELLSPLKLESRTVPFTPSAIQTLRREIERMYQQQGYFFARAESAQLPDEGTRKIFEIRITEGPLIRLRDVRFEGNAAVADADIRSVMTTQPANTLLLRRWSPGFISTETISQDLAAIESLYRERGYWEVKTTFDLLPTEDPHELELVIRIDPGGQTIFGRVEIEWLNIPNITDPDYANLLALTPELKEGNPFSLSAISAEQQRLLDEVVENGFPNAKVEVVPDRQSQTVRFSIDPGIAVRIGQVWIAGNTTISDALIQRELKFASGESLVGGKLRDSEQALYRLGYFRRVEIRPTDGSLDSAVEDFTVRVFERDTGFIDLGTAFNTEDGLHLSAEVGQRNFGGEGQSVITGVDGFIKSGSRLLDAGNARVLFSQPHLLGGDLTWLTEGFAQYSIELRDRYDFDRVGMSTSFRTSEDEPLRSSVGYSAFHERLTNVPLDVILGPDDTDNTFYSFVTFQLEYDRRDSPFNPRSGYRSLLQSRVNTEVLGSAVDFYALSLQQSHYLPVGTSFVWANNVRGEYLKPFGNTEVIPLSQRLFLGGRNSLRGFSLNAVGPRGFDGDIVGGDASLTFNTELQYDISESTVGVVFVDIGQAFLEEEGDFAGDTHDFDDFRYSPGTGIRYKTPIGPISAEIGINPERQNGERWGRFIVSIGGAF